MRRSHVMAFCLALANIVIWGCAPQTSPGRNAGTPLAPTIPAGVLTAVDVDVFDDRTLVTLQSNAALRYSIRRDDAPPRLIVELPGQLVAPGVRPLEVYRGGVTVIQSVSEPDRESSRVEIGLQRPMVHALSLPFDNTLLMELRPEAHPTAGAMNAEDGRPRRRVYSPLDGARLPLRGPVIRAAAGASAPPPAADQPPRPLDIAARGGPSESPPSSGGQRISLDFQQADLIDVLRLIAEVSGLNIITSPEVSGRVTTRMVNVPWEQALDMILKTHGLGKEQQGMIIRVAPLERLRKERDEALLAKRSAEELETPTTRTIQLNYARAEELKSNMEKLLTKQGRLDIDKRTNTIIVKDVSAVVDGILDLIRRLDSQTKQVSIEARIVETNRTFLQELGIRWGGLLDKETGVKFPRRVRLSGRQGGTPVGGNFAVDLPTGTPRAFAFGFSLISNSSILDIELQALEQSGRGRIISSPKVVTLDNKEALIESGDEVPFRTESLQTGPKVEFKDAKITLKVTPHVSPDDYVLLEIDAAKKEVDFNRTVDQNPTITSRQSKTSILIKDGATVVIGGLFKRTANENRRGVPGLSKVPYLGWLFKTERTQDNNEDLLFFITPRIVKESNTVR